MKTDNGPSAFAVALTAFFVLDELIQEARNLFDFIILIASQNYGL